jgi:hypothetical protein
MASVRAALIWVCMTGGLSCANAQQELHVAKPAQIEGGIDALPMLLPADTPGVRSIDAQLAALNNDLVRGLPECYAGYQDWEQGVEHSDPKTAPHVGEAWSRKVGVTMLGPKFFSLLVTDSTFCGGVHPATSTQALVFDLQSGALVRALGIAEKAPDAAEYVNQTSGDRVYQLVLPGLKRAYREAATKDCKEDFDYYGDSYLIWPDAASGTLVAMAGDLPNVVLECATELKMPLDEARRLGFDEVLLQAIAEAHKRVKKPVVPSNAPKK